MHVGKAGPDAGETETVTSPVGGWAAAGVVAVSLTVAVQVVLTPTTAVAGQISAVEVASLVLGEVVVLVDVDVVVLVDADVVVGSPRSAGALAPAGVAHSVAGDVASISRTTTPTATPASGFRIPRPREIHMCTPLRLASESLASSLSPTRT
ncbi:MAG: hypothetical protein ACR2OB_05465 [Solirubrobacteraceae bacterium]